MPRIRIHPLALLLLGGLLPLAASCSPDGGDPEEGSAAPADAAPDSETGAPAFGTEEDVERARQLWESMSGYRDWQPWPGKDRTQPGGRGHGNVVRYYVNETAAQSPDDPAYGSILVKENHPTEDADALESITVMQRIEGFAPEHGDWFWAKYEPDGTLAENRSGRAFAGLIGVGRPNRCVGCHDGAHDHDHVFANDG